MTTKNLRASYEYDGWANGRLLAVISQLTPEQFTRDVAGAYGSVRNTMVHIYSAQWGWLDRCGGATRGDRLDPADYPTIESLSALWTTIEVHLDDFLSRLTDEDLARNVDFQ